MTNEQLTSIFEQIHTAYFSENQKKIRAEFYPYRSLRHTIEWNRKTIHLKISQYVAEAPQDILQNLAVILFSKVYKQKPSKSIRASYQSYAEIIQSKIPKRKRTTPKGYSPEGNYFDLQVMFDELNIKYFDNTLSVKYLGWSKNKSYTRLGYYDRERELLVISKIFDSKKVPTKIIEYLLYHEMLHILIPTTTKNGRRRIHPQEFREREREFPDYPEIQTWIRKKRFRL